MLVPGLNYFVLVDIVEAPAERANRLERVKVSRKRFLKCFYLVLNFVLKSLNSLIFEEKIAI